MNAAQWEALAERCEAATGACRELDVTLCLAIDWQTQSTRPLREVVPVYGSIAEFVKSASAMTSIYSHDEHLPRFTASIDAITALIERELPGFHWRVQGGNPDTDLTMMSGKPRALLAKRNCDNGEEKIDGGEDGNGCASPALALCAAFCRAKARTSP